MKRIESLLVAVAVFLLAGCNPGNESPAPATLPPDTPNSFLQLLNSQPSLAAGDYTVVAATAAPAQKGYYTLTITHDNGKVEKIQGQWTQSGGKDPNAFGNPRYPLVMDHAGGVKIALVSVVDGYLYLVRNDGNRVVAEDDNSGGYGNPLIDLAASKISSVAYANAYYAAVDPNNERTTLHDFLQKNCFIAGSTDCVGETVGVQNHVVFRDSKDLGYGRNMHSRSNTNGNIIFYVDNYVIRLDPGSSSNYGPVNVEAAVRENQDFHVGTNAIEFSPIDPTNPASEKVAKFFTFDPSGKRITSADLDGRGVKNMPEMCWVCHGGRPYPLDSSGKFPLISQRSAKFNQLEVDSFEFSTLAGWSMADQQQGFHDMNKQVYDSYVDMKARPDADTGKWYPDFAMDIAAGRYTDSSFSSPNYVSTYVPAGWQQNSSRPAGVDQLYKRVIEPHCVACHSLQGSNAGEVYSGQPYAAAIDFSSWEKFSAYSAIVADYVFRRGVMPLSLRNWEEFWRDPQDKPALLASFLNDPTLFDSNGHVVQPGKPVARPGADRTVGSPAVRLDGTASLFAQTYHWQIQSTPLTGMAALDYPDSPRPLLTTNADGDYNLSLTVSNSHGTSDPVSVVVTINGGAPAPSSLTFVNDIAPILGSVSGANCSGCHNASSPYPGIPVWYFASDNPYVYRDVLARVNLVDPENSLLLMKPTTSRHGGGVQIDLSTVAGQAKYQTILEWVRAGAPCGYDATLTILCN